VPSRRAYNFEGDKSVRVWIANTLACGRAASVEEYICSRRLSIWFQNKELEKFDPISPPPDESSMSNPVPMDHSSRSEPKEETLDRDLEIGRKERRRSSTSSSSSSESNLSEIDKYEQDGHRPTRRDIALSVTRSRSYTRSLRADQQATATGLQRTLSRRDTVLSRIRSRPTVPPFRHPLDRQPTTVDVLVDFEGPDDPYRPINWPMKKKIITTSLYGFITMSATWASSSYSAGTQQVAHHFHVGSQVAVLGTTLFLFGFGLGPLLWAPLSEVYGRRLAVMVPMFIGMCFSFGSATAKDFQTLMLTRFFGAFFLSAPVTNTGGVLGDLYSPAQRGIAMAGYAMAVVAGPALGKLTS
jgi:DHA1 family multidrug resistance protein-like MFS transporter